MRWKCVCAAALAAFTALSAQAQTFKNGNFSNGTLNTWTATNTSNGVGAPGANISFDIDGPGPLPFSAAAQFAVGQASFVSGSQQGVEFTQNLFLTGGFAYKFDFDWAAENTNGANNAEGGRFALIVDGTETVVQAAGSIAGNTNTYGHITGYFVPAGNGLHTVGVRITRPFLQPGGLNQYVDNFTTTAPDFADPRFDSGNLASWNVANTGNGVGAPGTVAAIDIDGGGPLGTNNAAAFQVGQATFVTGSQQGVEITQQVFLPVGVTVTVGFNWSATDTSATSNAEGGRFALIVQGGEFGVQAAGSIAGNSQASGRVTGTFSTGGTGIFVIGARITRPFLNPSGGNLNQYVDNFTLNFGGGLFNEIADAGELPGSATAIPGSDNIGGIRGQLTGQADMYKINICNGNRFAASTVGNTTLDTQLFLFTSGGLGVTSDDDDPTGTGLQSRINSNVVAEGTYYLAVSGYDYDPANGANEIWNDTPFNVERAPDGPGAGLPVTAWTGSGGSTSYTILLAGVCGSDFCYANCDGSTASPLLTVNDFVCFQSAFASGSVYANCDQSTAAPVLTVNDFVCFQSAFAAGCP